MIKILPITSSLYIDSSVSLLVFSVVFLGCSKEIEPQLTPVLREKTSGNPIEVRIEEGRLNFASTADFTEAIANRISSENAASLTTDKVTLSAGNGFVSLRDIQEGYGYMPGKMVESISSNRLTAAAADTLIYDQTFASLVNAKGEIQVGEIIYKITPFGTFLCTPEKLTRLNGILDMLYASLSEEAGNAAVESTGSGMATRRVELAAAKITEVKTSYPDLYALEEGLYRYDTYQTASSKPIEFKPELPDENPSYGDGGGPSSPPPSGPYGDMRVYTHEPHNTTAGQFWDTITWGDPYFNYFNDRYRARVHFYNQDFLLFSNVGINVRLQKKGIWWNRKETEELRLGWDAIEYRQGIKYPNMSVPGNPATKPKLAMLNVPGSSKKFIIIPYNATLFGSEFEGDIKIDEYELIQRTIKKIWDYYKGKYGNQGRMKVELPDGATREYTIAELSNMPKAVLRPYAPTKDYRVLLGRDETSARNEKNLNRVFDWSSAQITLSANMNNLWNSVNVEKVNPAEPFRIYQASIYGTVKYNGTWKGVRIIVKP